MYLLFISDLRVGVMRAGLLQLLVVMHGGDCALYGKWHAHAHRNRYCGCAGAYAGGHGVERRDVCVTGVGDVLKRCVILLHS